MAEKGMSLRKQAFAPWRPERWTHDVKRNITEMSFEFRDRAGVALRYSGSSVYGVLMSTLRIESALSLF